MLERFSDTMLERISHTMLENLSHTMLKRFSNTMLEGFAHTMLERFSHTKGGELSTQYAGRASYTPYPKTCRIRLKIWFFQPLVCSSTSPSFPNLSTFGTPFCTSFTMVAPGLGSSKVRST
jgi:hypothetical protein